MTLGRRPRVLILVKGLGLGGVERLLSQAIPYLDRDRFEYEVCYFTPWKNDVAPDFVSAGIEISCLGLRSDLSPLNFVRVRRFLARKNYDIIHTHSAYPSAVARIVATSSTLRGFVHTEHSLPASRKFLTRLANRLTYPACDVVITVSQSVRDAVATTRPFRPRSTRLIYGGVDDGPIDRVGAEDVIEARKSLEIPEGHLIVGNVAHLRPQKGLAVWLDAAQLVLTARPATTFVLVGREKEPGYGRMLEERAVALGIADRVRFAGFQQDVYPYLAAFDVFLMSSHYEGFPIALVEAMAAGVPVVSTDVGGISEAMGDERAGFLAPAGDASELARHVTDLLGNASLRAEVARRGRERARSEFTIRQMVARVEAVYDGILGDARGS